ncbi:DUF6344 domain-containing protein [Streptomyces sp. NPDC002133]|uniref:DUF6344 domain-containing protein n=1 Tax=Streptomyces sp. NPDC002133 TaxID=3154409 RepID=UPI00331FA482
MAAAVKVKKLWTAFISLLIALLAPLGFAPSTSAAPQSAGRQPEEPSAQDRPRTAATESGKQVRVVRPRQPRDRSLPPTIKQRIRAEAHGTSPSVRHRPAAPESEADAQDPGSTADANWPSPADAKLVQASA